jgi:MFS family permease
VSRVAPAAAKGTAIGIYNSFQFAGVFAGGTIAGLVTQHFGTDILFWLCGLICLLWLALALYSSEFKLFSSRVLHIGEYSLMQTEALIDRIRQVRGVQEVTIVRGESLAYLKVDDKELDTSALHQLKQT